jgi:ABC-type branched-subunit amino acid transport system substrate-binding protein
LIFFTFLFVSDGYSAEARGVTRDTIKIGIMMSQTGSLADTGIPYTTGAKNYFRHLNDSGGINGRKINVLVEDDRYAIPAAIAAFKKLVYKDEIMAMMGAGGTAPITALFRSIEKEKMPTIAISLAESMVNPHKRYIFVAGATYREQMEVILDYLMNDLPIKKPRIAFVYPDPGPATSATPTAPRAAPAWTRRAAAPAARPMPATTTTTSRPRPTCISRPPPPARPAPR